MAKVAQYVPISTPYGWMVSIPPKLAASGKRTKKYFKTPTEAEKFAKGLRAKHEAGLRGGIVSATVAAEALEAIRVLQGSGLSLIEAARIAVASAGQADATETLRERYNRMLRACEEHWSARYTRDMGKIERWIGKAAMGRRCCELSKMEVERCVRANGAASLTTVRTRCRYIHAVLHFKDRPRGKKAEIEILSLEEAEKVLDACERPEDRRVVALLLFAGIRPDAEEGEIARLRWEAVEGATLYLAPEMTKTKTDRHVPILPRLAAELVGHPAEGKVITPGWKKRWQAIRKAAGIAAKQDVLRHTFASHFLAAYGEDAAKQAMGHTRGSDTLFRHYRRAVTREDGRKFFSDVGEK
jgi:integrase